MTETNPEVVAERLSVIARAADALNGMDHETALRVIGAAVLNPRFAADPHALVAHFRAMSEDDGARLFGAFKAAQKVLVAAGLPYMPEGA